MTILDQKNQSVKQDFLLQLKAAFEEGFEFGASTPSALSPNFHTLRMNAFWVVSDTFLKFHGFDPKKENESLNRSSSVTRLTKPRLGVSPQQVKREITQKG